MIEIVGRQQELESLAVFADEAKARPSALVLEGDAGMGKSTLWLAGVERGRAHFRVLSSRPAEAERNLAYIGLGDLLGASLDELLPALAPPRRRVLEVALILQETAGDRVDIRTLGMAVLDSLQLLAESGPVLIAIDDVQWFDDSSARVLALALRRLRTEDVRLLLARRVGSDGSASEVERAFDAEQIERLHVGPVSVGALQGLLKARLGKAFARPTLLRLHEASGGNPFYALELGRALDPAVVAADPTQPLPVPASLERLMRARLADLSEETRGALLLVAAAGRASPGLLHAAGVSGDALEPAVAANVLEHTDSVIRFSHPLLASTLYRDRSMKDRRFAHRLLAGIVEDPLGRARHLAFAADGPDAAAAAVLDEAAAQAEKRGAIGVAAELGEHARRLTPREAVGDRHRRTIVAGRMHLAAGNPRRARTLAETLLPRAPAGRLRAEALNLLSDVEGETDPTRAIALRREALVESDGDSALQSAIHSWLAVGVRQVEGLRVAEHHALLSLELAEPLGDGALLAQSLTTLGLIRFNRGQADAVGLVERAYDTAVAIGDFEQRLKACVDLAHVLTWSGRLDEARRLLEAAYAEVAGRYEPESAAILWYLCLVELHAGRFELAADYGDRQREIFLQYALDGREDPTTVWIVARVAASRGDLGRARALSERGRMLADGRPLALSGHDAVLGLVEAWQGSLQAALEHFAAAETDRRDSGTGEPSMYWWRADYAEALLEAGDVDRAVALLDMWEADARRLGREPVLAQVARSRGLVAAARGDVEQALTLLEAAVERHEAVEDPFGCARALLALGVVRRRARQKRAAREAIEAALHAFESIGAAGWAAKAQSELGRIGARSRESGLTAAERRVAVLVAEGRTNREVAKALFLGERTVASHLTHIYAKLEVRSRTELARKVQMF